MDNQTLTTIQQFAVAIPDHYQILDIILFGSRARGNHQPESDVDVAVRAR